MKYLICCLLIGSCYAYEGDNHQHYHNDVHWGNSIYSHANTANYIANLTYHAGHMNYNNPTADTDKTMLDYTNYNSFSR